MRRRLGVAPLALVACVCATSARGADPPAAAPAAGCAAPAQAAAPSDPATAALERGNELLAGGDAAGALAAYAESRRLAESAGEAPLAALASANAARAALEAGELDAASRELERALGEAQRIPDPRLRARVLVHAGRTQALLARERPDSGASARRAAEVLALAAKAAAAAGDARDESYALGWQGELYERGGRPEDALELTRRALAAGLRADAPDALYRWQWQAGRIERTRGRDEAALADYRQAAATLARLREETLASGSELAAATAGSGELQIELVDLLLAQADAGAPERQALLREALDALESQKVQELRDYFRDECLAAQRRAAPEEIPGVLVVYPVALPDRLEIIVGGSGGLETRSVPVDRETFTAEVRSLRRKLARRTTREYLRHAERLYDWVIRPLAPILAERRPGTLVFVPGGALRTVPLAALHDRERGEFLIEQYPVAMLPSLSLTDPRPLPRGRLRLLAAGISVPVQGYPSVERVRSEIEAVHAAFPGRTLLDGDFQVSRFVSEVEERPFGIVHVASHAEFSDDPGGSFLLAYDGKISLERLAGVVGTTRFRSEQPLELLALSACETAAGNDRAALGLAGVALRSGARSALATLWSVNDEAAARLVSSFYRELGRPELSRAQALQAAQLELLRTREWSHPGLWSPFVLISSWL